MLRVLTDSMTDRMYEMHQFRDENFVCTFISQFCRLPVGFWVVDRQQR